MPLKRIDKKIIPEDPREISLFSIIRNEKFRLPYFIDYYRKKGVSRFFFIDNNSNDEVQDFLLNYSNVHVFCSNDKFAYSAHTYLRRLVEKYGNDKWNLVLDADEFFKYPFEDFMSLKEFTEYLEQKNVFAVKCLLLDMYSEKKLADTTYEINKNPFEICKFFDKSGYFIDQDKKKIRGGVRNRVFGLKDLTLTKYPLFKCIPALHPNYWGVHEDPNFSSEKIVSGIVFHFKFFNTFIQRAKEEAHREEHAIKAYEYKAYAREDLENLNFFSRKNSLLYTNFLQLYRLNLVTISPRFLFYILILKAKFKAKIYKNK